MARWTKTAVVALAAFGCAPALGFSPVKWQIVQYEAPTLYAMWWSTVERCLGAESSMDGVRWIVVRADSLMYEGEPYLGITDISNRIVYLARPYVYDERVVRHEMIHLQTGRGGMRDGHALMPPFSTCARGGD